VNTEKVLKWKKSGNKTFYCNSNLSVLDGIITASSSLIRTEFCDEFEV